MENSDLLKTWLVMMAIALIIALFATPRPRRPYSTWIGDFFVKWGLAGLFLWFVVTGFWAVRELLNIRLVLPFTPLEGILEYYTYWSAALTGLATFIFFGATLFLNAIYSRHEDVSGIVYYKREMFIAVSDAELNTPVSYTHLTLPTSDLV